MAVAAAERAEPGVEPAGLSGGLGRPGAILGSVPHKLLHVADRPVVVVPIDKEARRGG